MRSDIFLSILRIFAVWLFLPVCCAEATTYTPDGDIIGTVTPYTVKADDNLYAIARVHDLGIVEVLAANPGIDSWVPEEGSELTLPTTHVLPQVEHRGIVINLSELRLFYFPDPHTVMTFPIGIGKEGWQTPTGHTSIVLKRKNPVWIPPASIRAEDPDLPEIFPAGPDNPLGDYALDLAWRDYRIHGTNRPYGVGKRVSHGCIRLYPEDISVLFSLVEKGTPVTIIDTNYKLGWQGNRLWLEVTPTQKQADKIARYREPKPVDIPEIHQTIEQMAGNNAVIDWYAVDRAVSQYNGVPVVVAQRL
jgi:L,D-transpeptidase ErfK/SrfK